MKNQNSILTISFLLIFLADQNRKIAAQSEILGHTYLGTFEGHAYYKSNCYTNWTQAADAAEQMGGYLATITSQEEDNFFATIAPILFVDPHQETPPDGGAWVGLICQNGWEWINNELFDYSNWGWSYSELFQEPIFCPYGLVGISFRQNNQFYWFTDWGYTWRPYIVEFDGDPGCNNPNKTYVCHNGNTICVNNDAVQSHLNHGDYAGPCGPCNGNAMEQATAENAQADFNDSHGNVLGMEDSFVESEASSFEIFPNPASDEIIITFSAADNSQQLSICNQLGETVFIKQIIPGQSKLEFYLDANVIPAGVYYASIKSGKEIKTKKLIVAH